MQTKVHYLFIFEGTCAFAPLSFESIQDKSIPKELIYKELKSCSYSPLLSLIQKHELQKKYQCRYYPQKDFKKVIKILKEFDFEKNQVSFLGYSWGCDSIMKCLPHCEQVEKVYTIDPIRRGLLFLGFIQSIFSNSRFFKKHSHVKRHINLYQKTDRFCLPLIHLRGNSIDSADVNINLSKQDSNAKHTSHNLFLKAIEPYL